MAQQTLDLIIANQIKGQSELEKFVKQVERLDERFSKFQATTAGAQTASQNLARSVGAAANALKQQGAAADALRARIDPMFAAQKRFNDEMDEADRLLDAGAISLKEYAAAQNMARQSLRNASDALFRSNDANRSNTNLLDAQSKALRNQRQGMQMAGMQINDFVTSVSTGASPVQAFNQQIGQLGYALSMMGSTADGQQTKLQKLGNFLAGPWSIAVIGAAMVVGPMIERLFGLGEASEKAAKTVEQLVEEKKKSAIEARNAEIAENAYGKTLDGVRAAIIANKKALSELNLVQKTAGERALESAGSEMKRAAALQLTTLSLLLKAKAELTAIEASLTDPTRIEYAPASMVAIDATRRKINQLTEDFANANTTAAEAARAFREAISVLSVERGMRSVEKRINDRYDAEIEGARKAALARGDAGLALEREVERIEAARRAELKRAGDAEGASKRAIAAANALEDSRKRELEQAQAIAEKIRDMGLVYGASNKQIGETAKKLDDFNDMVEKLKTLYGGEKIYEELAATIEMVRQSIVDEGADKALAAFNAEVDKLIKKDLTPFEQSIAGLNAALANEELRLDPEAGARYYEGLAAAARPFFTDAIKGQQDLLDKAIEVDNAFQQQVDSLKAIIASMQAAGAPTAEFEAMLERLYALQAQNDIVEKNKEIQRSYEAIGNSVADGFKGMITGAQSFGDAMKNVIQSVIDELFRLFVVQQIVGMVSNALTGAFGGGSRVPADLAADFDATFPRRALGGSVSQSRPYLVGERGPELFMPGKSGTVIPTQNTRMGGSGSTINVSVDARGATSPEMVRQQVQQGILEAAPSIVAAAEQRTITTLRRPRLAGAL